MEKKRVISFDGVEIGYDVHKGELPFYFVFIHGIGGNRTVWKNEMLYFTKRGYGVVAMDMRGHGMSSFPQEFDKYRPTCFSRDFHIILKKEKVTSFVMVGHSIGGAFSINYCMRYKRHFPKSLVLIESTASYPFDHTHIMNQSPYIVELLRFISRHKLTREKHFSNIDFSVKGFEKTLHTWAHLLHITPLQSIIKTLDNVEKYCFNNQSRINWSLEHISIPTLLLAGAKDHVVPAKFSKEMKSLIKKAELKILPGADHHVIIEHPISISHKIEHFLKRKKII